MILCVDVCGKTICHDLFKKYYIDRLYLPTPDSHLKNDI